MIKDLEVTRSLCVPKWVLNAITNVLRRQRQKDNFPGAAVDGHLPANAGDIGLIPGLGGFYMSRATKPMYHNHWVCAQSVSLTGPNAGWTASHLPTPRGSKGEYTLPYFQFLLALPVLGLWAHHSSPPSVFTSPPPPWVKFPSTSLFLNRIAFQFYLFTFGRVGPPLWCRGSSSLPCAGFSSRLLLLLWSTGSRRRGSVVEALGL